jgi:hypothetical protein
MTGQAMAGESTSTWADGFGTWHARVPAGPMQKAVAWEAIVAEHAQRDNRTFDAQRHARAYMAVVEVPTGTACAVACQEGTAVYRESWPSDDDAEEAPHEYRTQMCGSEWFSADGDEAQEVRLWDGDTCVAMVRYAEEDPDSRGTYRIAEHRFPGITGVPGEQWEGWQDWRDALEFASATERTEWDRD